MGKKHPTSEYAEILDITVVAEQFIPVLNALTQGT